MPRRSRDFHITGWVAVALLPIAIPLALIRRVFGTSKSLGRTPAEVVGFLRDFMEGSGGEWDWDDFTSTPIAEPALEQLRIEAAKIALPITAMGREELKKIYERAELLKTEWLKSK